MRSDETRSAPVEPDVDTAPPPVEPAAVGRDAVHPDVESDVQPVDPDVEPVDPDVEPVDPDVDLHIDVQRHELDVHPGLVLGAIAVGGVLGSEARYALGVLRTDRAGVFPWTTLAVNVTGCLIMGAAMLLVRRTAARAPLVRPFLAVGVLGGYTTFSAYGVGVERLLADGHPAQAFAYLVLTPLLAVPAVAVGGWLARAVARSPTPSARAGRDPRMPT